MPDYSKLATLVPVLDTPDRELVFERSVVPFLVDTWLAHYGAPADADIVSTTTAGFSYLFDVERGRLIAAWGISGGRHSAPRPRSRMAGHPLGGDERYHRGHAIPHTLGGPADINLVPQLGAVNVGPFRELERAAVATPGSLYFTHWIYGGRSGQRPSRVEQGLLEPGAAPRIRLHAN